MKNLVLVSDDELASVVGGNGPEFKDLSTADKVVYSLAITALVASAVSFVAGTCLTIKRLISECIVERKFFKK